ncbi:MAG: hypothetical protein QOE71_961 [Pseudonocardiales bacterium]|nr:hypothetical protein [Pseudonocardiales bacterium]
MTDPDGGRPWVDIVVPTLGRDSLPGLLLSIATSSTHTGLPAPPIYLVDDRPAHRTGAALTVGPDVGTLSVRVLRSTGRGPAAARNVGWRAGTAAWICFLDDDVLVEHDWLRALDADLTYVPPDVAGSQARITVPLPSDRRPNDWERGTAGLQRARWITADMAYRRDILAEVGGFDEGFPRAFREDADLALRVLGLGYRLVEGRRCTTHPVRPFSWWASLNQQRGNADDVRMRRVHGAGWRRRAHAPLGRRPQHLLISALGLLAGSAALAGKARLAGSAFAGWAVGTAEFAGRRIAPGPRDFREIMRMLSTSVVIPPAASWFWLRALSARGGVTVHRPAVDGDSPALMSGSRALGTREPPLAVLLDRDGTIVKDIPYNGDPSRVEPLPGAAAALDRLRAAGIPVAVITNQSAIGRGMLTRAAVDAVNRRIEELLGPFDAWLVCPHRETDGCGCRKPAPGLVKQAAQLLGISVEGCVVIGDIGSDIGSARNAGARAIMVPTERTRTEEILAAPVQVATLGEAVDLVLGEGKRA